MFTEADAVRIARAAHAGQVDLAGRPYIGHPMRVMAALGGEHERMAAVLHDVIEDTEVTAADLRRAGCPEAVVVAVVALSKTDGEAQEDYLARVAANPLAVTVKRPDIADNTSPARMACLDEPMRVRLTAKYTAALAFLDSV